MDVKQRTRLHRSTVIRTVLFYALIASLWIILSDTILGWMLKDPELLTKAQTIKGWLFVLTTATLLHLYLSHCFKSLRQREEELEAEQEKAQKGVQERFHQLNSLFDSMNAVVYVADFTTHELLYINRFAAETFGQDWKGKKCYHYLQKDIEQPCDFCTNSQLIGKDGPGPTITWEFLNTRNQRWYECFDKAIQWSDGRLARLEIALDITERKELEIIKDNLLSSVSHEMRTPLTAISGFTELLLDEKALPERVQDQLQTIFRESERMIDLVNNFLDARRLKTDRSRVNYQSLKLAELYERALKSCRDRKPEHEICFHDDIQAEVFGNKQELTQVIRQLLSNACRYSPNGGRIELRTKIDEASTQLCIKDQGIGIPEHELENIFKPFHRLDTGDNRSSGGIGMGLVLAKEIVALHGGSIKVDSTLGKGSCFYLNLPHPTTQADKRPTISTL